MHNMKFRVESMEHSEQIQRELFRLGYDWNLGFKHPIMKKKNVIFTNVKIIHWNIIENFESIKATETTLDELKAMK